MKIIALLAFIASASACLTQWDVHESGCYCDGCQPATDGNYYPCAGTDGMCYPYCEVDSTGTLYCSTATNIAALSPIELAEAMRQGNVVARNVDQNFEFKGVKNISKAAQLTE